MTSSGPKFNSGHPSGHQSGVPIPGIVRPERPIDQQFCQQIAQRDDRWVNVPDHLRRDWTRCLNAIQSLEERIEHEKKNRHRWARYLKWSSYIVTFLFNLYSAAQILVYALVENASQELTVILSTVNGIASLAFWGPMQKQSNRYLIEAKDLKALSVLCSQMRAKLRKILQDGKIDFQERIQIINMIGEIHRVSQDIGEFDIFLKILGGSDSENSFAKSKEYQALFKDVDEIVSQLSGTQNFVERQVPEVIHQYQRQQLFNPVNPPNPYVQADLRI